MRVSAPNVHTHEQLVGLQCRGKGLAESTPGPGVGSPSLLSAVPGARSAASQRNSGRCSPTLRPSPSTLSTSGSLTSIQNSAVCGPSPTPNLWMLPEPSCASICNLRLPTAGVQRADPEILGTSQRPVIPHVVSTVRAWNTPASQVPLPHQPVPITRYSG